MKALCPDCGDREGDVVERATAESGTRVTFCCPGCDHEWDVPL
ncbi:hypothetical protein [Halosimplex marinum]